MVVLAQGNITIDSTGIELVTEHIDTGIGNKLVALSRKKRNEERLDLGVCCKCILVACGQEILIGTRQRTVDLGEL